MLIVYLHGLTYIYRYMYLCVCECVIGTLVQLYKQSTLYYFIFKATYWLWTRHNNSNKDNWNGLSSYKSCVDSDVITIHTLSHTRAYLYGDTYRVMAKSNWKSVVGMVRGIGVMSSVKKYWKYTRGRSVRKRKLCGY